MGYIRNDILCQINSSQLRLRVHANCRCNQGQLNQQNPTKPVGGLKALARWAGKQDNAVAAQEALLHRAHCNSAARNGSYSSEMEG